MGLQGAGGVLRPAPGTPQGQGAPGGGQGAGTTPLDAARQRAMDNAIPLTPDMIYELGRRYGATKRAEEEADTLIASPVNRPISVSFDPSQATNIIQTARGYPSALSFFDSTGQPWPVAWDTNSNAANVTGGTNCNTSPSGSGGAGGPAVDVVGFYACVPVKGSNTIEITPMSLVSRGGLLVHLEGAPKPLSFLLIAGRDRYDADLSVHVDRRGPNARVQIDTRPGAPVTGAAYLTSMLAGVAPAEAPAGVPCASCVGLSSSCSSSSSSSCSLSSGSSSGCTWWWWWWCPLGTAAAGVGPVGGTDAAGAGGAGAGAGGGGLAGGIK